MRTSAFFLVAAALVGSISFAGPSHAEQVVNVDFQFNPSDPVANPSVTFSGQGALTAAGTTWNGFNAPVGSQVLANNGNGIFAANTNPPTPTSFTENNLVDSTGAATGLSVTANYSGIFAAQNGDTGNMAASATNLMREYLVSTNGPLSVDINGLTPGGVYNLALYGAGDNAPRDTTFSVAGVAGSQSTVFPGTPHSSLTLGEDYVLFNDVVANGSGQIAITYDNGPGNGEADFNGFQIQSVPEPSAALALLGLTNTGLIGWAARRKNAAKGLARFLLASPQICLTDRSVQAIVCISHQSGDHV